MHEATLWQYIRQGLCLVDDAAQIGYFQQLYELMADDLKQQWCLLWTKININGCITKLNETKCTLMNGYTVSEIQTYWSRDY